MQVNFLHMILQHMQLGCHEIPTSLARIKFNFQVFIYLKLATLTLSPCKYTIYVYA